MQHRGEVAEPLRELEPAAEHRVVHAEDLRHSPRPADPLADVRRQRLGGKTRRLGKVEIGRAPTAAVHLQGGVSVLGDGLHRDTTDVVQGAAAEDRARSAEE